MNSLPSTQAVKLLDTMCAYGNTRGFEVILAQQLEEYVDSRVQEALSKREVRIETTIRLQEREE